MSNNKTPFRPEFDTGLEQYLFKWIHKNLWKVQKTHTFDDFYQEGYLLFLEAVDRYGDKVDNQDWFMSLYKTMLFSWTCDQAVKSTRSEMFTLEVDVSPTFDDNDIAESVMDTIADDNHEGMLNMMIKQAPQEVADVLRYVFETPAELLAEAEEAWKASGKKKPGGNQFLCKMLGYNPEKVNLEKLVVSYFQTQ